MVVIQSQQLKLAVPFGLILLLAHIFRCWETGMQRKTWRAERSAFSALLWPCRICRQGQGQWVSSISDSSLRNCMILLTESHQTLSAPHTGGRGKRSSTATSQCRLPLIALEQQGRNWLWVGVIPAPCKSSWCCSLFLSASITAGAVNF